MVSFDSLLGKFPLSWRSTLKVLGAQRGGSSKLAERCMSRIRQTPNESSSSSGGEIPDWHGLLKALCDEEPRLDESGIHLSPRFVLLPFHFQRAVLTFLEKHRAELPISMLEKLLNSLQNSLTDDWCKFYHHRLHIHVSNASAPQAIDTGYVSQKSTEYLNSFCDRIKSERDEQNVADGQPRCDWLPKVLVPQEAPCGCRSVARIPCIKLEGQGSQRLKRKHGVDGDDHQPFPSSSQKRMKVTLSVEDIFPDEETDRQEGVTPASLTADGTPVLSEVNEPARDLWKDKLETIFSPLRDALKSAKGPLTFDQSDLIKKLVILPLVEVEAVCSAVEMESLPVVSLAAVCQQVVTMPTNFISFTTTKFLANCFFAKQILDLKQTVSRNLVVAVAQFARTYSKPFLDGCLIPYLQRGKLGPHQADLLLKIVKDCLDNDSKILLLRALLQSQHLSWNEHVTAFVQGIIAGKVEIDSETVSELVTVLTHQAGAQDRCPKFAKLLLAVVNKFRKQLTNERKIHIHGTVERNQTFLKKALALALKKCKE